MSKLLKNKNVQFKQYSGIAGVLVLWATISAAMAKAHLGLIDNRPISFLGVYHPTRLIFMFGLIASAVFFLIFAYHLVRSYVVKNNFLKYFIVGQIGQITAAIFPDTPHTTSKVIHTIAAFTLAFSLPLLIREFAVSQKGSNYSAIYYRLFKFELITFIIGIGLFIFTRGIAPIGEILPTVGFHLWIIVLTYISIRSSLLTHYPKKFDL